MKHIIPEHFEDYPAASQQPCSSNQDALLTQQVVNKASTGANRTTAISTYNLGENPEIFTMAADSETYDSFPVVSDVTSSWSVANRRGDYLHCSVRNVQQDM